jgi:hypothetical protein
MSVSALDTHRTVKRLIEAGFSSEQAETVTDILGETRAADPSQLVTKAELAAVEASLKADLRTLELSVKADIRELAADLRSREAALIARFADAQRTMMQWIIGLFMAQIAVIAGFFRLLGAH